MQILVLGAGMMGSAAAFDLAQNPSINKIILADLDQNKAQGAKEFIGSDKIAVRQVDITDTATVSDLMTGCQATIGAVSYKYNYDLARAAIRAKTNFCDLGGNNTIVDKELSLNDEAKRAGINIVPDCGLAPGMVSILASDALFKFDELNELHIRVGGLPQNPKPPLNYKIVFSPTGLINEYIEETLVIHNGKIESRPSMTEIEEIEFPPPFGKLECFNTSGGASTLVRTFLGKVKELNYKTIRYPGHCERFKMMLDLGLVDKKPVRINNTEVTPRTVFEEVLLRNLENDDKDVVLVRLTAKGKTAKQEKTVIYNIIDYHDEKTGLSAMMRMTAFPASIIAQMMASGEILSKGAVPQELCVPPKKFINELAKRNIEIKIA